MNDQYVVTLSDNDDGISFVFDDSTKANKFSSELSKLIKLSGCIEPERYVDITELVKGV